MNYFIKFYKHKLFYKFYYVKLFYFIIINFIILTLKRESLKYFYIQQNRNL